MNRDVADVADVLLVLLGVTVIRVVVAGAHTWYVKPSFAPFLVAAAVLVIAVAALDLLQGTVRGRAHADAGGADHGHDHSGAPGVAAFVVLPVATLLAVAPQPLGLWSAEREGRQAEVVADVGTLPTGEGGAADTTLLDVVQRMWSAPETLEGVPVRLVAFVSGGEGTERGLTRLAISCCAADGRPVSVDVDGPGAAELPADGEWVEVTGTWDGGTTPEGDPDLVLTLEDVSPTDQPAEPYLS